MPDDVEDSTRRARDRNEAVVTAAGDRGLGEYRCVGCGYGIVTLSVLPTCPMCHGSIWTATRSSPFRPR
jgi:hypothetical protein